MLELLRRYVRITFLLFVTAFIGCGKQTSVPNANDAPETRNTTSNVSKDGGSSKQPAAAPDLSSAKADYTFEPKLWKEECKNNPKGAKEKYTGKVIQLTGTIETLGADPYRPLGIIYLRDNMSTDEIRCYTADPEPWWKVSPGSKITLKGTPGESVSHPGDLIHCVIVEASPNQAIVVNAEQLAKDVLKNGNAAVEKYSGKYGIVEGELVSKKENQLVLKGDGKTTIQCAFGYGDIDEERMATLKIGQKVKVFGQIAISDLQVGVDRCLMKGKGAK